MVWLAAPMGRIAGSRRVCARESERCTESSNGESSFKYFLGIVIVLEPLKLVIHAADEVRTLEGRFGRFPQVVVPRFWAYRLKIYTAAAAQVSSKGAHKDGLKTWIAAHFLGGFASPRKRVCRRPTLPRQPSPFLSDLYPG